MLWFRRRAGACPVAWVQAGSRGLLLAESNGRFHQRMIEKEDHLPDQQYLVKAPDKLHSEERVIAS